MSTLVLAGRYEIIEKIGDGGMAVVYKARDKQLSRFVALKILKKEFIADQAFVENFIREAKAAASLLHPNIVTIYDAGKDRDIYYIVMEYVEGRALSEVVAEEAPLDYKRCIRVAKQVASALDLAHRNNIIHRDVKPHNILITPDGTAKITDFGIAKAVSDGTIINDSGIIMGSVHYFSPEQSRGQYVDEKSDIYSLGIVLYEMITGRVPFDADNPVTIAVMHMNDTIIPPSRLVKGVPPGLDQIVLKATAKYQSDRFSNIDEMYKALDNVNFITGVIDGPAAGFVAPAVMVQETPGQGQSVIAEPEPPVYDEPYVEYIPDDEPDYRRSKARAKDDYPDDDFYDDDDGDDKKPGFFAALLSVFKKGDADDSDDGQGARRGKLDKRQKMVLIIAAVAIAVVLSFPLSKLFIDMFGADPVMVPDVVGEQVEIAQSTLTDAGFDVEIEEKPLPAQTGAVLPEAGEDVTDLSGVDAAADTGDAGSAGTAAQYDVGEVMEQDPPGGEMARPGTTVHLIVASAPVDAPEEDDNTELGDPTEVPDLSGKTKANAEYAIKAAGFGLGVVDYDYSDQPVDTVIAQSPKGKEMAPENSKINIVISQGPKPAEVTGVAVTGAASVTADAEKDVTSAYTATVTGDGTGFSTAVSWAVSGHNSVSISESGVLTVKANAGAGTVTITATSKTKTSVKGTVQVTIAAAPQKYTLTVSGGSGGGNYAAGTVVSISAGGRDGFTFKNWTSSTGSFADANSASTTFTMPASNVTVTANYTQNVQKYTVTFKDYNGTVLKTEPVTKGGNATPPPAPSRSGYTFAGWDGNYNNVQANVTITATYTQNQANVPSVVGQTAAQAKTAIEGAGFVYLQTDAHDADVPVGNVISQNPAGGSALPGTTISVVVSLGPE